MARIIHTADWHVGRNHGTCKRHEDHREVLAEVCQVIEARKPDLVIHAGDVFDIPRPATEDLQLAIDTLQRISDVAPTLVLLGNHDSPAYFRLFNTILRGDERLRFVIRAHPPEDGGIIDYRTAAGERIRVAPVPFIHENRQIDWFGDPNKFMGKYAERIGLINQALRAGLEDGFDPAHDILVYAAHLYVDGAHRSGKAERELHVSEVYATQTETLPQVSYAAFGHIHKPQPLPGGRTGRYCGSTLQLDFGEEGEQKSLVQIDAAPGKPAEIEVIELTAGRPLVSLRGTLEELGEKANDVGRAIVRVVVDTDEPIADLADRVRELLPEAEFTSLDQAIAGTRIEALDEAELEGEEQLGVPELFGQYLAECGTRTADAELVLKLFGELDSSELEEERPAERIAAVKELLEAPLPPPPEGDVQPEPPAAASIEELPA